MKAEAEETNWAVYASVTELHPRHYGITNWYGWVRRHQHEIKEVVIYAMIDGGARVSFLTDEQRMTVRFASYEIAKQQMKRSRMLRHCTHNYVNRDGLVEYHVQP